MKSRLHWIVVNALGWYGIIAILVAYALTSFELISAQSIVYHVLNFTGGVGLVIEGYSKRDYPPVVLNVIWAIIAIVSLVVIFHSN